VSAVLRQCLARGETDSAELWRLIAVASSDELRTLLEGTAAQPFLEPDNARMFGSIRAVASNAIAALESSMRRTGWRFRCGSGYEVGAGCCSCRTRPNRSRR
jgi:Type IV secretion-system coupling protein DNA-binding domain